MDKIQLRKNLLHSRKQLDINTVNHYSQIINQKLHDLLQTQKITKIAIYQAINNEVIIDEKKFQNYIRYVVGNKTTNNKFWFELNNYHLENAIAWNTVSLNIEAIIVPIVGFNKSCDRIGYGQGNYDIWLKNFAGLKIGIAYDFQKINVNFQDVHDISLDIIITENNIYYKSI